MDVMRYVSYGLLVGVPLAVVFSEKIGCPAKVSGPSMRVCRPMYIYIIAQGVARV